MIGAETLSAMLDGEAEELEVRRLLRDLEAQPEERQRWERYHLARAALHGEPLHSTAGFSVALRAALDAEPVSKGGSGGWRRAVGSLAVAASVAMVVVLGGQQLYGTGPGGAEQARIGPLPVGVANTIGAVPVQASYGTRAVPVLQPAERTAYRELARQRLRRYSLEHAEHAALNTPAGMLPYARVPVIERGGQQSQ